jgi:hypothetical protein
MVDPRMFRKRKYISIRVQLYSGLHHELNAPGYDPYKGMELTIKNGTRLMEVLAGLGIRKLSSNAYFVSGRRIGLWTRLRDGNEVFCVKPGAGG